MEAFAPFDFEESRPVGSSEPAADVHEIPCGVIALERELGRFGIEQGTVASYERVYLGIIVVYEV